MHAAYCLALHTSSVTLPTPPADTLATRISKPPSLSCRAAPTTPLCLQSLSGLWSWLAPARWSWLAPAVADDECAVTPVGLPQRSPAQKIQSKFLRRDPPLAGFAPWHAASPSYCAAAQFSYWDPVKESVFALLSYWDVSLVFVLAKFKQTCHRRCIRMIETFFRLRCSNILCLPRFFVPCDIQTFPGSAKKDKYLRPSLFVLMMMMMKMSMKITKLTMMMMILVSSGALERMKGLEFPHYSFNR